MALLGKAAFAREIGDLPLSWELSSPFFSHHRAAHENHSVQQSDCRPRSATIECGGAAFQLECCDRRRASSDAIHPDRRTNGFSHLRGRSDRRRIVYSSVQRLCRFPLEPTDGHVVAADIDRRRRGQDLGGEWRWLRRFVRGDSHQSPVSSIPRYHALRWSEGMGYQTLGVLPSDLSATTSNANDVSADGSVVVGRSDYLRRGFHWTAGSGMVANGVNTADALGVSANGEVIVGHTTNSLPRPYRWTAATGAQELPNRLPDFQYGGPSDISANGEVIVGYYQSTMNRDAWVWTAFDGMKQLPSANLLDAMTYADGVSRDGSTIAGQEHRQIGGQFTSRAVVWRKQQGAYQFARLSDILLADGVDFSGWALRQSHRRIR